MPAPSFRVGADQVSPVPHALSAPLGTWGPRRRPPRFLAPVRHATSGPRSTAGRAAGTTRAGRPYARRRPISPANLQPRRPSDQALAATLGEGELTLPNPLFLQMASGSRGSVTPRHAQAKVALSRATQNGVIFSGISAFYCSQYSATHTIRRSELPLKKNVGTTYLVDHVNHAWPKRLQAYCSGHSPLFFGRSGSPA